MSKFIAGIWTTCLIILIAYSVQTKDTGMLIMSFFYLTVTCLVAGINFGMFLEKETPTKKE